MRRPIEVRAVDESEPAVEQRLVRCRGKEVLRAEEPLDVVARCLRPRRGELGRPGPVAAAAPSAQHDRPIGDRLDAEAGVVLQPGVDALRELLGRAFEGTVPLRRSLQRIVGQRVKDPGVAANPIEPGARAERRVLAGDPADEDRPEHTLIGYVGSSATSFALTVSPGRPLSRKTNSVSGEMTYGGLHTTSPKRSPAAASKKLPARNSTFSMPFSAALNSQTRARARSRRSQRHAPRAAT